MPQQVQGWRAVWDLLPHQEGGLLLPGQLWGQHGRVHAEQPVHVHARRHHLHDRYVIHLTLTLDNFPEDTVM